MWVVKLKANSKLSETFMNEHWRGVKLRELDVGCWTIWQFYSFNDHVKQHKTSRNLFTKVGQCTLGMTWSSLVETSPVLIVSRHHNVANQFMQRKSYLYLFFSFVKDFELHSFQTDFLCLVAVNTGTSLVLSSLLSVLVFAGMQMFSKQLGSTEWLTILGGFLGSVLFICSLTVSYLWQHELKCFIIACC